MLAISKELEEYISNPLSIFFSKVAFAKVYDRKNAITAADILNDRILPFFEEQQIPMMRILTDRGSE